MKLLRFCSSVILAALLSTAPTLAEESRVVPTNSQVDFSLKHLTGREDGEFENFSGTLDFREDDPSKSKVIFSVSIDSLNTRNRKRDAHLRSEDYFDAKKFPSMTFESLAFKPVGKNRYKVTGPLTIRGVSKPISVSVKLVRDQVLWATGARALRFESTFEIDRRDFGVGGNSALLGNDVRIELDLEFQGTSANK